MATQGVLTTLGETELLENGTQNFSHMAIGVGTADPLQSDTALGDEKARGTLDTDEVSGDVWTAERLYPVADAEDEDITEIGIFDAASGGNLLLRGVTGIVQDKGSNEFIGAITLEI